MCSFSLLCHTVDTVPLCAGLSDVPGEAMVKLYCPKCQDAYTPKSSRHHHTDGAYFGTGFPHMLFMVHPEYRPKRPANQFVPRYAESGSLWCAGMIYWGTLSAVSPCQFVGLGLDLAAKVPARMLCYFVSRQRVGLCGVQV